MLMSATQQIFRGEFADGGVVRHDLIAPKRPLTVRHQPDRGNRLQPRLHARSRSLAMQENPVHATLVNAWRKLGWIGNKAEDEAQIAMRTSSRHAVKQFLK